MTTWFVSDLHLGHRNVVNHCNRKWVKGKRKPTEEETMIRNNALIAHWNSVVSDDIDDLGDLAFCTDDDYALSCVSHLRETSLCPRQP